MPEVSLVVCLYRERDMLERQLGHAQGCYDDLVVVHDGPDDTNIRSFVESHGGRFFEQPRCYDAGPHYPFGWAQARHDWVLRWDADEFPSEKLKGWLQAFRAGLEPSADVSGYTCILPLWDGKRACTAHWPRRVSMVHRQRVRYFGMIHESPFADGRFVDLDLILQHQPKQKNFGVRYTVARTKVRRWQDESARALLRKPTDLPCWRWNDPNWPRKWEQIRRHPLLTALARLVLSPYWNARDAIRSGDFPWPSFIIFFPLQHWLVCMRYMRVRRQERKKSLAAADRPAA